MENIKVELEIPEDILTSAKISRDRIQDEVKRLFSLELYREGFLSLGKACEFAGITKWEFFEINKKTRIPLNIENEDWEEDRKTVEEVTT